MSFDDHIRGALDKAVAGIRGHLEADLRDFAENLGRSAAEERARAIAQAVEAATADVRRQAEEQLAQLRDSAQKHQDALQQSAEAQAAELRRQLEETRAQLEAATRDLETAHHELDAARRDLDAKRREVEALTERVHEVRDEVEQARRVAALEVEEFAKRQLLEAAGAAEQRLAEALDRARAESQQAMSSQVARLAGALRAMDDARTLGGVLNALVDAAAREVERAAVLVVRGSRLAGWRLSGFDNQAAAQSSCHSMKPARLERLSGPGLQSCPHRDPSKCRLPRLPAMPARAALLPIRSSSVGRSLRCCTAMRREAHRQVMRGAGQPFWRSWRVTPAVRSKP